MGGEIKLDDLKTRDPVAIAVESGLNCHEAYLMRFCGIPYVIGLKRVEEENYRFYSEVKKDSAIFVDDKFHILRYQLLHKCRDGNMRDKAKNIFDENRDKITST